MTHSMKRGNQRNSELVNKTTNPRRKFTHFSPRPEFLEDRTLLSTILWDNVHQPNGGNWNIASNWVGGLLPQATDDVVINLTSGAVTLSGGTDTVNSITANATTNIAISGANLSIASTSALLGGLTLVGGSLSGTGAVTVSGSTTWTGGSMTGTGTTEAAGPLVLGSTTTSNATNLVLSGGRSLINDSAATFSSTKGIVGISVSDGSTITNKSGSTFTFISDASINDHGGSPDGGTFVNQGTISTNGTTSRCVIGIALNNTGTIQPQSGSLILQGGGSFSANSTSTVPAGAILDFQGGSFTVASGAAITAPGEIRFSGATVVFNGVYNITGLTEIDLGEVDFNAATDTGTLIQDGGTLAGTGLVTIDGDTTWNGGTMTGTGTTESKGMLWLGAGGPGAITDRIFLYLAGGRSLKSDSNVFFSIGGKSSLGQGLYVSDGSKMTHGQGAVFAFFGGASIKDFGGTPDGGVFINQGTLAVNSTSTSLIDIAFTNQGIVQVNNGALTLNGNLTNFDASTSTLNGGIYALYSGTLNFANAKIINNKSTVILNGASSKIGDLSGKDALANLNANLSGGAIFLQAGKNLSLGSFTNTGQVEMDDGSTLTTADFLNHWVIVLHGGTLTSPTNPIVCTSGGISGYGTIDGDLIMAGGTVDLGVPGTTTGTLSILGNLTGTNLTGLRIEIGGPAPDSQYDVLKISGAVSLSGQLQIARINGYLPPPNTIFRPIIFGSKTGDFTSSYGLDFGDRVLTPSYDATGLNLVANMKLGTSGSNTTVGANGLAAVNLSATDLYVPASSLVFTITSLPAGTLYRPDGTAVTLGSTFTGSPVGLTYQIPTMSGSGNNLVDSFNYTVSDGTRTSTPTTMTLSYTAPSSSLVVVEGTSIDDSIQATNLGGILQLLINGVSTPTGINVGSITQMNVLGGDGNDSIRMSGLAVNATLDGGSGTNTLTVEGTSGADQFSVNGSSVGYSGATITGSSPLIVNGLGGNDTFKILVANSAATLNGGDGNDTFVFSGGATLIGSIDGGSGSNSLNDSAVSTPITLDLGSATITGLSTSFANIQKVIGGTNAGNTIKGSSAATTFYITGSNAGSTSAGLSFSGFGGLVGGVGNDTFSFNNKGSLTGTIDGGGGVNLISETGVTSLITLNLATATLTGISSGFLNILYVYAGGNTGNTILGPASATTFKITGPSRGSVAGIKFSGFTNLVGGAGNDTFSIANGVTFGGTIDGGAGISNAVDDSLYTTKVTLDLSASAVTGLSGSFANIQKFVGGANANNTVKGTAAGTTFTITGANAGSTNGGISFSGFGNLAGGAGNDTFYFKNGSSLSGTIDGGGGTNTLSETAVTSLITLNLATSTISGVAGGFSNISNVNAGGNTGNVILGPASATTFNIAGANRGNVAGISFTGFRQLNGGAGNDTFAIGKGVTFSGTIDGGGGSNWLDYSAYTTGVVVNLGTGAATGFGAAIANISNVRGGSGNDSLTGNSLGNILIGGRGNDTLVGGSGISILIGGTGSDIINGGSGGDLIIGGSTIYDSNNAELDSILAEWRSADSYATRIADIKNGGGLNGTNVLNLGTTVVDDLAANILTGAPGAKNWYFKGTKDSITDLQPGEQVN